MLGIVGYLNGLRQMRAGNWAQAESLLQTAVENRELRHPLWTYRLAYVLTKQKRWTQAEKYIRLALEAAPHKAHWHAKHGMVLGRLGLWEDALAAYDRALTLRPNASSWQLGRAECLKKLGNSSEAEAALQVVLRQNSRSRDAYVDLSELLVGQKRWWEAINVLQTACGFKPKQAELFFQLGTAQLRMSRFAEAAESFQIAVAMEPENPTWNYQLGFALHSAGNTRATEAAYSAAIRNDKKLRSGRFGIGAFHQAAYRWTHAAEAYARTCALTPEDESLQFRVGFAHERCYRWNEAEAAYSLANASNSDKPDWHYRLGFILEREGRWDDAAGAYCLAASMPGGPMAYYYYRMGYVLMKAGQFAAACRAFVEMRSPSGLPRLDGATTVPEGAADSDRECRSTAIEQYLLASSRKRLDTLLKAREQVPVFAKTHYLIGLEYERLEEWERAIESYEKATARSSSHEPDCWYRLGFVLKVAGRYRDACDAFLETRILKHAHGVPEDHYNKSLEFRTRANYTEYYESLPVEEKVILYESFHGESISCNPYAIFRHLLTLPEFDSWTHVWVITDPEKAPADIRKMTNVVLVKRQSDVYLKYLCTASVLINNNTFPPYFIRRTGQRYLNTWHGTPLKLLGKRSRSGFIEHRNASRNLLQATHIISPNPHTTRVLLDDYDIRGLYRGIVANTGYPRIDHTKTPDERRIAKIRERLRVVAGRPLVLYAPTYRGSSLAGETSSDAQHITDVLRALSELDCTVRFRGHHMAERSLADAALDQYLVPADLDTNELLAATAVLVTDYSSVMFDFLVTGRPLVLDAYDQVEYETERGFYFGLDEVTPACCDTVASLVESVSKALLDPAAASSESVSAREKFCALEDGKSSHRVVELLFHGSTENLTVEPNSTRKTVLFYGGALIPNGLTNSLINLLSAMDRDQYAPVLLVEPTSIESFPDRLEQLARLPAEVAVLGRVGAMNYTLEEQWIVDRFNDTNELEGDELRAIYSRSFRREGLRLLGPDTRVDIAVCFEGYQLYWMALMAELGVANPCRRVCYQHNDMYREWKTRFAYLKGAFALYRKFDALVSVSRQTRNLNKDNLAKRFGLDPAMFTHCSNIQDTRCVAELVDEPLENPGDEELMSGPEVKFIVTARLSPEKGHTRLLRAFAALRRERSTARLIILGDGPLRLDLEAEARSLGIQDCVNLLGWRKNPYPYLKRSDCFVLSSVYEGQGLVLVEAMRAGLPVICTDFPPAHDLLEEGRLGLIVENSEAGLLDGMRRFLAGELEFRSFDLETYQRAALREFHLNVLGESGSETESEPAV